MIQQPFSNTIDQELVRAHPFRARPQYELIAPDQMMDRFDSYADDYEYEGNYARVHNRALIVLVWVAAVIMLGLVLMTRLQLAAEAQNEQFVEAAAAPQEQVVGVSAGLISPVFAPSVQHWAPQIVGWAADFGLDPNMVATVMQIESCGDPQAESWAGAQGLFQVMPFHFGAGEDMKDPDTNARRGMKYLLDRLNQTGWDVGRAFAGYNGGHGAAATGWNSWARETQRYFTWSTGIYGEAQSGATESATLQQWMAAGGASLCAQAERRLGLR